MGYLYKYRLLAEPLLSGNQCHFLVTVLLYSLLNHTLVNSLGKKELIKEASVWAVLFQLCHGRLILHNIRGQEALGGYIGSCLPQHAMSDAITH